MRGCLYSMFSIFALRIKSLLPHRQLNDILSDDYTSGATHIEVHFCYLITGSTTKNLSQLPNSTRYSIESQYLAFVSSFYYAVSQFANYLRCIFHKYTLGYLCVNSTSSSSFMNNSNSYLIAFVRRNNVYLNRFYN